MIIYKNTQSTIRPEPMHRDDYSVYIRTNIRELTVNDECGSRTEYIYDEERWDAGEYIDHLRETISENQQQITDTQLAVVEIYEIFGGGM